MRAGLAAGALRNAAVNALVDIGGDALGSLLDVLDDQDNKSHLATVVSRFDHVEPPPIGLLGNLLQRSGGEFEAGGRTSRGL